MNRQNIDVGHSGEGVGADSSVIPLDNIRVIPVIYGTLLIKLLDCHSGVKWTASEWHYVRLKYGRLKLTIVKLIKVTH